MLAIRSHEELVTSWSGSSDAGSRLHLVRVDEHLTVARGAVEHSSIGYYQSQCHYVIIMSIPLATLLVMNPGAEDIPGQNIPRQFHFRRQVRSKEGTVCLCACMPCVNASSKAACSSGRRSIDRGMALPWAWYYLSSVRARLKGSVLVATRQERAFHSSLSLRISLTAQE